jgi:hypothetical protein
MAHFVKLDANNIVIDGVVVNNDALDPDNEEASGIAFLNNLYGLEENWKQTSYNCNFRYNFAGIDYTYDADADAFIAPRPECGHSELFLNDSFRWNCQRCELDMKARLNGN